MNRAILLDLAEGGLRMPIGTDLVLREKSDVPAILLNGKKLGEIALEAARRYHTPLAIPIMDLLLEKSLLLHMMGIKEPADTFQFTEIPADDALNCFGSSRKKPLPKRMKASVDAVREVAHAGKPYIPIGMSIGPLSLTIRLLADPITPIYMAGSGISGVDEPEVKLVETLLELSTKTVLRSIEAQLKAGATAIFLCEPAANKAYFSPKQIDSGSDVWERFVMAPNRRVAELIQSHNADLLFHCCGELTDPMVHSFGTLEPALLSLGSSRNLAEDAMLIPTSTVIYGNLPSKKFFSDEAISTDQVAATASDLIMQMKHVHHPFILGTECDVLSVPGYHDTIVKKVETMLTCCPEATSLLVS